MAHVESNFAVEPLLPEPDRTRSAVTPMVADRERLLFAALVLVHLIPIWAFSYFATDDGPSHVYNASVLRDYDKAGSETLREYCAMSTNPDPNWFGRLVLAGLMPTTVAEKVIVSGYVILLPLAMRYVLRAIRPAPSSSPCSRSRSSSLHAAEVVVNLQAPYTLTLQNRTAERCILLHGKLVLYIGATGFWIHPRVTSSVCSQRAAIR